MAQESNSQKIEKPLQQFTQHSECHLSHLAEGIRDIRVYGKLPIRQRNFGRKTQTN